MYKKGAGLTDGRQEFKRLASTRVWAARDVFQRFLAGPGGWVSGGNGQVSILWPI